MLFSLEALKAKHGDCLLLHYGSVSAPRLVLIDGGPSGVHRRFLAPRLRQLRQERSPDQALPIELLMLSHIDDDHIRGVLDLTDGMIEDQEDGRAAAYDIRRVWHNSFNDILDDRADLVIASATAEADGASLDGSFAAGMPLSGRSQLILASVPQGRKLRLNCERLGLDLNPPNGALLTDHASALDLGEGLELKLIGPSRERILALRDEWDRILEKKGLAQVEEGRAGTAAYLDTSAANLSSLVVLAEADGKRMLLTGDARGDDILATLRAADLLEDGRLHVDLLKLPHHGSDRNVETDFFRRVTADHYVVSGDGRHGNPEVATFEMILAARGRDSFVLHLTYPPGELRDDYPVETLERVLARAGDGDHRFEVRFPEADGKGIRVDLLEPMG